jgi:hypothetical protein
MEITFKYFFYKTFSTICFVSRAVSDEDTAWRAAAGLLQGSAALLCGLLPASKRVASRRGSASGVGSKGPSPYRQHYITLKYIEYMYYVHLHSIV